MAGTSVTDPYLQAYYAMQSHNVQDQYGMQSDQNNYASQQGLDTYAQRMNALQNKLNEENDTFRDSFASRGLLHSGIYSNDSPNYQNMGALQRFGSDTGTAEGNLALQQKDAQDAFANKGGWLGRTENDQLQGIQQLQAADVARSAINDAITSGG